jgi:superfamily I DNA/RNA helicase
MLDQVLASKNIARSELGRPVNGKIRWGSVQSFKGLEAMAVVLVEFEPGYGASRETFYVAATRTLSEFVFVYPQSLLAKVF